MKLLDRISIQRLGQFDTQELQNFQPVFDFRKIKLGTKIDQVGTHVGLLERFAAQAARQQIGAGLQARVGLFHFARILARQGQHCLFVHSAVASQVTSYLFNRGCHLLALIHYENVLDGLIARACSVSFSDFESQFERQRRGIFKFGVRLEAGQKRVGLLLRLGRSADQIPFDVREFFYIVEHLTNVVQGFCSSSRLVLTNFRASMALLTGPK